ncbi:hypothetical protein RhiirB3_460082 [Rhizophagus irregularis]|nr:hypothetical protein RhiirB3_460082 [Rhizophagus irregularis]
MDGPIRYMPDFSAFDLWITSSEIYSGNLLSPIKNRVNLPNNLYEQLITYYNEVYGKKMDVEFSFMSNLISQGLQNDSYVVVQPIINQCERIEWQLKFLDPR